MTITEPRYSGSRSRWNRLPVFDIPNYPTQLEIQAHITLLAVPRDRPITLGMVARTRNAHNRPSREIVHSPTDILVPEGDIVCWRKIVWGGHLVPEGDNGVYYVHEYDVYNSKPHIICGGIDSTIGYPPRRRTGHPPPGIKCHSGATRCPYNAVIPSAATTLAGLIPTHHRPARGTFSIAVRMTAMQKDKLAAHWCVIISALLKRSRTGQGHKGTRPQGANRKSL